VYPERFAKVHGPLRGVVERVLRGFLKCGIERPPTRERVRVPVGNDAGAGRAVDERGVEEDHVRAQFQPTPAIFRSQRGHRPAITALRAIWRPWRSTRSESQPGQYVLS
jgi:hypothetical protein